MSQFNLAEFEEFRDKSKKNQNVVSVSSATGRISFSAFACSELNIQQYKFALLLFNKSANQIAIQFFHDNSRDNLLRVQHRSESLYICAERFLKKFQIQLNKTLLFTPEKQEVNNSVYILIDLNKPIKESNR